MHRLGSQFWKLFLLLVSLFVLSLIAYFIVSRWLHAASKHHVDVLSNLFFLFFSLLDSIGFRDLLLLLLFDGVDGPSSNYSVLSLESL